MGFVLIVIGGVLLGVAGVLLGLLCSVIAPVVGGVWGAACSIKGPCPYCGYVIHTESKSPGITCRACKKRIVIKGQRFYKVA